MFDQYTSLDQMISQNPDIEGILNSYGIPYHRESDNSLNNLKELSMIYGVSLDEMLKNINGSTSSNNLF